MPRHKASIASSTYRIHTMPPPPSLSLRSRRPDNPIHASPRLARPQSRIHRTINPTFSIHLFLFDQLLSNFILYVKRGLVLLFVFGWGVFVDAWKVRVEENNEKRGMRFGWFLFVIFIFTFSVLMCCCIFFNLNKTSHTPQLDWLLHFN